MTFLDQDRFAIEKVERAYLMLLQVPHTTPLRDLVQPALANLRDALAATTGRRAEYIQNTAEKMAAAMQPGAGRQ